MSAHRRRLLSSAAVTLATIAIAPAHADPFPSKPIIIVVPFANGGSADILARALGSALNDSLKQPVVIDNKTGAGGLVGTTAVANGAADGYTLLLTPVSLYAINPSLYGKKAQDAMDKLMPVVHLAEAPLVLAVNSTFPGDDFPALLAQARKRDTGLSYGTPGVGTDHHLLGELIAKTAGAKLNANEMVVDCSSIDAMVARPGDPGRGEPISALTSPVKVDIAYGGSCTGGKLEDIEACHAVLAWGFEHGLQIAPDVEFYLQFGSDDVRQISERRGMTELFQRMGVRLVDPGCGACINAGPGASRRPGQVTVSAINRNFPGRSGPGDVWLASPSTVAASALAGHIIGFAQLQRQD